MTSISEVKKQIEDTNYKVDMLNISFGKMETDISWIKTTLRDFIISAKKNYATKSEVQVTKTEIHAVDDRVKDLEDNRAWATRLVLGIVITAVFGVIFASKL